MIFIPIQHSPLTHPSVYDVIKSKVMKISYIFSVLP